MGTAIACTSHGRDIARVVPAEDASSSRSGLHLWRNAHGGAAGAWEVGGQTSRGTGLGEELRLLSMAGSKVWMIEQVDDWMGDRIVRGERSRKGSEETAGYDSSVEGTRVTHVE